MLLEQRQLERPAAGEERAALVDRVAGLGVRRRCRGRAPGSSTTCAKLKIASFEPSVGTISRLRVELDAEAAPDPAGDRLAQLRQTGRAAGSPSAPRRRPRAPARIRGSVGSRGSPMPKSSTRSPRRRARRFASSRRTNGYVAGSARTRRRARPRRYPASEPLQRLEARAERGRPRPARRAVRVARLARARG